MSMNKREKFLLVALAAAIILLGGFHFLIKPQLNKLAQIREEYALSLHNKKQAENNILKARETEEKNDSLQQEIRDAALPFFPELQSDRLHIFFDGLARNAGISYDSLLMTSKTTAQILGAQDINTSLSYPAKDAAAALENLEEGMAAVRTEQESAGGSTAKKDSAQPKDLVETAAVTLRFQSSYEQVLSLLDEIKNSGKTVRISSINISQDKDLSLITNITVECYGIVKPAEIDTLPEDPLPPPAGKSNPYSSY